MRIKIFGEGPDFLVDPVRDRTNDSAAKAVKLEGSVEELTHISAAHDAGFDGSGSTIAIIDTGISSHHEQFEGRIIREACFGSEGTGEAEEYYYNVCSAKDSAIPSKAKKPANYDHGTHVAGIAAGKDGIAPKAKIIAVQAFTERVWSCSGEELKEYACPGLPAKCCSSLIFQSDKFSAYDFLLDLIVDEGIEITVLNMSYGFGEYSAVCDSVEQDEYAKLKLLTDKNVIAVASSGNEFLNEGICRPACFSNVFSAGALWKDKDPILANFSNHNALVDITAPGTSIRSSYYVQDPDFSAACTTDKDCYGYMSGTSQAAPIVSGAFALLHQAYPEKRADELKTEIIRMTDKKVTERDISLRPMSPDIVTKPVLDFSGFANLPLPPARPIPWFRFPDLMPELPRTGFSAKAETSLRRQPLSVHYTQTDLTVMIPALSVESDVLTVSFTENEYPVEWLGSSVGMLEGSAEPGQGAMVFTGHNHLNNTESGPFAALGILNNGDRIMLRDGSGKLYTYTVFSNELVKADDIAGFEKLANQEANSITLLTCEEEQQQGGYAYRRVITAVFDGTMK